MNVKIQYHPLHLQVKYYPDKLKRIGQILSDACLVKNLHRKKRDQDFRTVIENLIRLWKVSYLSQFDRMPYIYREIFNLVNLINLASWKKGFQIPLHRGEKSIDYIETTGEEARWWIYTWRNVIYTCIPEMIFLVPMK